jgi:hypothetical protein
MPDPVSPAVALDSRTAFAKPNGMLLVVSPLPAGALVSDRRGLVERDAHPLSDSVHARIPASGPRFGFLLNRGSLRA